MIHDLFHELGHAAFAILGCGAKEVAISLGDYGACDFDGQLRICFKPAILYKSLYRESVIYSTVRTKQCSAAWFDVIGGIFGILLCSISIYLVAAIIAFRCGRRKKLATYDLAPAWILTVIYPYLLIAQITKDFLSRTVLGFGALIIQLDLTNDFYYSFFPSRLIIFKFLAFGDGTKFWQKQGYTSDQIVQISYYVFAALVVNYLIWIVLFASFVFKSWKSYSASTSFRSNMAKTQTLEKLESIGNFRLSVERKLPRQSLIAAIAEHFTEEDFITEDDFSQGDKSLSVEGSHDVEVAVAQHSPDNNELKVISSATELSQVENPLNVDSKQASSSSNDQNTSSATIPDKSSLSIKISDDRLSSVLVTQEQKLSAAHIVSEDQIVSQKITSPIDQRASVAFTSETFL